MNHLEAAKECIAIAESGDAKREAYRQAAEHIAAELQLRTSQRAIARAIGKDESFVRAIIRWKESGYTAATPWLSDEGATTRAARSHTRRVLETAPVEEIERIVESLPRDARQRVAVATDSVQRREQRLPAIPPTPTPGRTSAYLTAEGEAARALRSMRALIEAVRVHEWDGEEAELLGDRIGELRHLVDLASLAVEGSTSVDWDAELSNLTGGSA